MPKITGVADNGSIISLTILDEGEDHLYHLDRRPGLVALENLQSDANLLAAEKGLGQGFLDCLEIDYRTEPWGGLAYLAPLAYDSAAHNAALAH